MEMLETPVCGPASRRSRPGSVVLGKDHPFERYSDLAVLDEERVLVGCGGSLISSPRAVQVRRWPDLQWDSTLPAGADVFDVRPPELLASGPLWRGERQSAVRMDLDSGRVLAEYPLRPPFLLTDGGFIGCLRRRFDFETEPVTDPALLPPWPELAALVATARPLLVSCDWRGRVRWVLEVARIAPEFSTVKALARTPEGTTFCVATERALAEVDTGTGLVRWHQGWHDAPGTPFLAHAAVIADATRVVVAGHSDGQVAPLRVLDRTTRTVRFAGGASDAAALDCLAFHGRTLLAGTRSGGLLLLDEAFTRREVRLSRAAVNQVLPVRGGVLAACNQRELRFLPLLDDE
ncbi:hypothetical protein [Melittangium boletus]|uniref:hypothetical protein n=1 Tax=Melittangium boletus TaxID=83453 RepID=UPI003DA31F98